VTGWTRGLVPILHIKPGLIIRVILSRARDHANIRTLLILVGLPFLNALLALRHIAVGYRKLSSRIARSLAREFDARNYDTSARLHERI